MLSDPLSHQVKDPGSEPIEVPNTISISFKHFDLIVHSFVITVGIRDFEGI